jgi:hypothetical protein
MSTPLNLNARQALQRGLVIPACPLALTSDKKLDDRRQRGLFRYYLAAGAGGLAVGVHTTQFEIRDAAIGLLQPVLELAVAEMKKEEMRRGAPVVSIAGVCGRTKQAVAEALQARELGYHAVLLSLGALKRAGEDELIAHCREIAALIPLVGFYLQPAAGGRILAASFWRRFAEIENVAAIKIAPFNRYQTLDVVRAVAESGRDDIALYTGNDDHILLDLITPFRFKVQGKSIERRIVGGLLGHWAVWTKKAVELLDECHRLVQTARAIPPEMLRQNEEITDANAAFFDAANGFAGCIPGIHEALRREGLLEFTGCLDSRATLSSGQAEEIDRVFEAYPHLSDRDFVRQHRDEWLRG